MVQDGAIMAINAIISWARLNKGLPSTHPVWSSVTFRVKRS